MRLTNKAVYILTLLVTVATSFATFYPIQAVSAGYITRTVTVTNLIGSVQTNYPIDAVMSTTLEISSGRMRSDCGDIRVYATDFVTPLSYALIDCNTTYTSVVFLIPSMPIGVSTYYITYGDPLLSTSQNPTAVFDIYEMWNTSPSCALAGSANWNSINNWLQLTPNTANTTGSCNYSYLSPNTSRGYKAFFDVWAGGTLNGREAMWQYAFDSAVPAQEDIVLGGGHFTFDDGQNRICYTTSVTTNGTCNSTSNQATLDNSTWRNVKVSWDTSQRRVSVNSNAFLFTNTTGTAPNLTNTNFGFASRNISIPSNERRVRNLAVMRYSALVAVAVAAIVRPPETLTFQLRNAIDTANFANSCDFGDLDTVAVGTCQYRLKYSSTARNGYSLQVRTSGNFTNGLDSFANAAVGSGGTGGTLIVAGTEGYGAAITAGSCTNGTNTLASSYNPGAGNSVSFVNTTAETVMSCDGPNLPVATDLTNTVLVDQRIAISGSTPPGLYTQTVTWTAVPNY